MQRMYEKTKTWNPAVGCNHNCIYCKPSFQVILKRFYGKKCEGCGTFSPHEHPERLNRIPTSFKHIFMFGNGDFAFYNPNFVRTAIKQMIKHIQKYPDHLVYFQTKAPDHFFQYIADFNPIKDNVIFLITLETNRDEGYERISKAMKPYTRYLHFREVPWNRKIVTIEPVLDFDIMPFVNIIQDIHPERVYLGFNSRPKQVQLPEPSRRKFSRFYTILKDILKYNVVLKNTDRLTSPGV